MTNNINDEMTQDKACPELIAARARIVQLESQIEQMVTREDVGIIVNEQLAKHDEIIADLTRRNEKLSERSSNRGKIIDDLDRVLNASEEKILVLKANLIQTDVFRTRLDRAICETLERPCDIEHDIEYHAEDLPQRYRLACARLDRIWDIVSEGTQDIG